MLRRLQVHNRHVLRGFSRDQTPKCMDAVCDFRSVALDAASTGSSSAIQPARQPRHLSTCVGWTGHWLRTSYGSGPPPTPHDRPDHPHICPNGPPIPPCPPFVVARSHGATAGSLYSDDAAAPPPHHSVCKFAQSHPSPGNWHRHAALVNRPHLKRPEMAQSEKRLLQSVDGNAMCGDYERAER